MGLYEPMHQLGMWADFQGNGCMNASPTTILEVDTKLDNQVLYFASWFYLFLLFSLQTLLTCLILNLFYNEYMQSEDTSQGTFIPPSKYDQEASNKPADKVKK